MPRKHAIILSLLVVVPLITFFVLGVRLVENDQHRTQRQFEQLLEANLAGIDRSIASYFLQLEQQLLLKDVDPSDPAEVRRLTRSEPLIEQIIVLNNDGTLMYPDTTQLSDQEMVSLMKVERLIRERSLLRAQQTEQPTAGIGGKLESASETAPVPQTVLLQSRPVRLTIEDQTAGLTSNEGYDVSPTKDHGWYIWYWGNGIQLIHWRKLAENRTLAIVVPRVRWMADVIASLPDSDPSTQNRTAPAQIRLVDAVGSPIYLWGSKSEIPKDATPVTSLHLSSPLKAWQLQHFGPSTPFTIGTSGTLINLLAGGGLLSVGLFALAFYLSREVGRQTRDARQKVNFVNQVSHELKTPLTNIRMYADLLEHDLRRIDPDDDRAESHLNVITAESRRLSRLINNVLTFSRWHRDAKKSKLQAGRVDRVIETVLEQFRPALDKLEMEVALDLDADSLVALDIDALEQMLGNLISNVEKYAGQGRHLRIASRFKNSVSTIDISDAGPGISPEFAKRIFQPFERESDHIEAATGTGIGLTITRALAQRAGGDLTLRESSLGACFRITLATPLWEANGRAP